jgi:hypothetical protein
VVAAHGDGSLVLGLTKMGTTAIAYPQALGCLRSGSPYFDAVERRGDVDA